MTADTDLGIEGLENPVLIGQGGYGSVYRAEQPSLGRTVAVKILSVPGMDDGTRARFTRECMAIGALSGHPHIVTVYDSGINAWGRPYIVMDHMARGSMGGAIARDGAMPWPDAVDTAVKIAGAVATAHSAGILHRDIKPSNVLISGFNEPKLADFGISSIGGDQTSSGSITASLEHAAPELLDGAPASIAADVYALASTVFTLIAGAPPFERAEGETIQSLIARIVSRSVPDLRPRGVPGAVCDVLERSLAKSPAERFEGAARFAEELRDLQERHDIAPTPFVQAATGGFEVLDRFAPTGGSTSPTRTRLRPGYVAPPPPTPRPPLWRRRSFVVAVALSTIVLGTSAVALTRDRRDQNPRVTAAAETPDPTPSATRVASNDAERSERKTSRDRRDRSDRKDQPRTDRSGTGSGGVPAIPPPIPDSPGSAAPADVPAAPNQPSGSGTGGSDGSKQKEKEPPAPKNPPPPTIWLYHLWKGRDHVATINPSAYPSDYARKAEGLVYNYRERGTMPIETAEGTMFVFAEQFGDTEPDVNRTTLYKLSKGGQHFYTSDETTKQNYYTNWSWGIEKRGFIGE